MGKMRVWNSYYKQAFVTLQRNYFMNTFFSGSLETIMNEELDELKELFEQLKIEVKVEPINVSVAIKDLMKYMETNKESDKLVIGFPTTKDNPFTEKSGGGCSLI